MWNKKAQTTMIFIVLIIIIFIGMTVFLLSLSKNVSQSEYINIYTHSLLSSILKTDTGFTSSSCKTVSDLLACSFLTPTIACDSGRNCMTLAEQHVNDHMSQFAFIKEGFRYLLTVEPEGFVALPTGTPYTIEIGDPSLKQEKTEKFTAIERTQKILGGNPYILTMQLTIARKSSKS